MTKHLDLNNIGKTLLVVIDGQIDFTDRPNAALPVPGGVAALAHTADFIRQHAHSIDAILATRDKHVPDHIAHPVRWVDRHGVQPSYYTQITLAQIDAGDYRAAKPHLQMLQRNYVADLEARGEDTLVIWPPHCLAGTPGYEFDPVLAAAFAYWEEVTGQKVVYLDKGEHPDTEQYGAFAAAVPVSGAPGTFTNMRMVNWVNSFSRVYWAGLALSHCVAASMVQVRDEMSVVDFSEHTLLIDCTAAVPGFEDAAAKWVTEQEALGLHVVTAGRVHEIVS